jgi:hypothetical protein
MIRIAVLLLAFALVPADGGAAAAAPRTSVKNVSGWITALAMDGPRVAYATNGFAPTNCDKVFAWNVVTRSARLVSGPAAGRCSSDEPHGQPVRAVAVGGTRVAWIRTLSGNSEVDDALFAAALPLPREARIATAVRSGDAGGTLTGTWLGGLVGSGSVLVANNWTTDAGGAVTRASLNAVGARRLAPVAQGTSTIVAAAADTGRIAVARSDGTVAVYSAGGRLQATIRPSSLASLALRKDYLVVLTKTKSLEVYNSRTGAFVRRFSVPGGARNLDVYGGIAVFSVYRTLYGLQLTTGKRAVLATPSRAVFAAQIEASGVVYAYNTVRGTRSIGNLVFVPFASVRARVA